MQNTHGVLLLLLGGVLFLLSGLIMTVLTGPTLHTDEFRQKGFGGNWTRRETLVFFLFILLAVARARYWLPGLFITGSLLMAYGMACRATGSSMHIFRRCSSSLARPSSTSR